MKEFWICFLQVICIGLDAIGIGIKNFAKWIKGDSTNVIVTYFAIFIMAIAYGIFLLTRKLIDHVDRLEKEGV